MVECKTKYVQTVKPRMLQIFMNKCLKISLTNDTNIWRIQVYVRRKERELEFYSLMVE